MLLRTLALAIGLFAIDASASPLPDYPFVFTAGTAKNEIAPDLARLAFTVAARNSDAKLAAASVDSTFNSVLTILATAGIRESDINASAIDKSPRSHWDPAKSQSVADGYEVSRKVKIIGRDLTKYPQMVKALLDLPHTEEFSAEFDRSDRSKIEAELVGSAARDAQARGQRMAEQFGRKLGPVHAIARTSFDALPGAFGLSYRGSFGAPMEVVVTGARKSAELLLAPATIEISESVNVIYELQPAQ